MAAYAVVDWSTGPASLEDVLAAIETKLETLDSTTNTIRLLDIVKVKTGSEFMGFMVYDG